MALSSKKLKSNDDIERFFKSFTSNQWLQVCIPVQDEKNNSTDKDTDNTKLYQCPNANCISKKKSNKRYVFTNKKHGYSNIKNHLKNCVPFTTLKAMLESTKGTSLQHNKSLMHLGVFSLSEKEEKLFSLIKVIVLVNMPISISNNRHMREFGGMVDSSIVHSNTVRGVLPEMRLLVEAIIANEIVSVTTLFIVYGFT